MIIKVLLLLLIMLLSPVIGGLYGIVHDQVTYTISPEYFTKFKFYQFGLNIFILGDQRVGAMLVGILATWWVGLPIGVVLGSLSMLFSAKVMLGQWFRALLVTLAVAAAVPLFAIGAWLIVQRFSPSPVAPVYLPAFVPEAITVDDTQAFKIVGIIHNFSYIGGLLGLIAGSASLLSKYRKQKKADTTIPS